MLKEEIPMNIGHRLIVIIVYLMVTTTGAYAAQKYLKLSDKQGVEFLQLVTATEGSDVIFIGETHDEKKHHENQLEIIRALYARNVPVAIGLEMFTSENQQQLDDWTEGKLNEQDFRLIYSKNWSYDWSLYRDIFIFARDNHIPIIALNIPKQIIFKVAAKGSSALKDDDKKELPSHISWTLNVPQTEYLRAIFTQVFGNQPRGKSFSYFCEAQALRNSGMAWNIAKYTKKHPKKKIVVLTGTWHAVKSGIPEQLEQYDSLRYKVILPELPEFNSENATSKEADYLMVK